jgi:hypothetical protein
MESEYSPDPLTEESQRKIHPWDIYNAEFRESDLAVPKGVRYGLFDINSGKMLMHGCFRPALEAQIPNWKPLVCIVRAITVKSGSSLKENRENIRAGKARARKRRKAMENEDNGQH